jgi:hypothetical protein
MLNTTYPEVNRTDEVAILINNSHDLLHLSTFEHLELLHRVEAKITQIREQKQESDQALEAMRAEGYIMNSDYVEIVDLATEYKARLEAQQAELERLGNLSWWDRLWNYKVYV